MFQCIMYHVFMYKMLWSRVIKPVIQVVPYRTKLQYESDGKFYLPFLRVVTMVLNLALNTKDFVIPGMYRLSWGAQAPMRKVPLHLPVTHVRLTHTGTTICTDDQACCKVLQIMQNFYMDEALLSDIPYNFMIGGDGLVYKGRGWYNEPARPPNMSYLSFKCLDIAFIGNFKDVKPSKDMEEIAFKLIRYGIVSQKIKLNYKLIQLGETPTFH